MGVFLCRARLFIFAIVLVQMLPFAAQAQTGNDAEYIQNLVMQSQMEPDEELEVTVRMKNIGSTTWTAGAEYYLGSQNPADNSNWGLSRVDLPHDVEPNETVDFTFTMTAPHDPGVYNFQWQMVQENVGWFGGLTDNFPITVGANGAVFLSQEVPLMQPGQPFTAFITMHNSGGTAWTQGAYFLGSENPEDNEIWGTHRVPLNQGVVHPGNPTTFELDLTAPDTPGTYNFQWRMLQEGVERFGAHTENLQVTVGSPGPPQDNADFISQSPVPPALRNDELFRVLITMRNNGGTPWVPGSYVLGALNDGNNIWGLDRVNLVAPVPPGEYAIFDFISRSPLIASGDFPFHWRMGREVPSGIDFFGEASEQIDIEVNQNVPEIRNALFVSQAVPASMLPGATPQVSITMRNVGNTTWRRVGAYRYGLGSQNPQDNVIWGLNRVRLADDEEIPIMGERTFQFEITAPDEPGPKNFQWQMLREGLGWFGNMSPNVVIQVQDLAALDGAEFTGDDVPEQLVGGQTYVVNITVRNTGQSDWTRGAGYKLVATNGRLVEINTRFDLPPGVTIGPGQEHTFTFDIAAPPFQERALLELRMIHEGVGWVNGEPFHRWVDIVPDEPSASQIVISPTAGPPGTVVTVTRTGGYPFTATTKVRFSFGDDQQHAYSLVPVQTTFVNASQLTFTVPANADCGNHFVRTKESVAPASNFRGFTVGSPCDPTRRGSLKVLTYNVAFVGSPIACNVWCATKDFRAPRIPPHADLQGYDVIVFEEAFSDYHRQILRELLRDEYPYQGGVVGQSHVCIPPFPLPQIPVPCPNGGVFIVSKWPIQAREQTVFRECCFIDCMGEKGVSYVRIDKAGQRYNIFGTHLDADLPGESCSSAEARSHQLGQMDAFADAYSRPDEATLFAGDFNIDQYGSEFSVLTSKLQATAPPVEGYPYTSVNNPEWIDYVLTGDDYLQPVANSTKNRVYFVEYVWDLQYLSDHFAVLGTFQFPIGESLAPECTLPPAGVAAPGGPSGAGDDPTPTFTWTPIEGARSYDLEVTRASDGTLVLYEPFLAGTSFVVTSPLPANADLDWTVRGRNQCGSSPASHAAGFRIQRGEQSPPVETPVANWPGGAIQASRPSFSWSAVDGATSYTLHVFTAEGEALVLEQAGIPGPTFRPASPLPSGPLFWMVRGDNEHGPGPSSGRVAFERDMSGAPALSVGDVTVGEATGSSTQALVPVSLSFAYPEEVTVMYWAMAGTARADADFTPVSGTLHFSAGTTAQTVAIPVAGDALDEATETFFVGLALPVNATLADSFGQVSIVDDDPPPTVAIADRALMEGNAGTTNAALQVTLSTASGQTVTVDYATVGASATAPGDYVATSGTLTFAEGETVKNVLVPIVGDAVWEERETLSVVLSAPVNVVIADGQGQIEIVNDDLPTLSISDVFFPEAGLGIAVVPRLTVSLNAPSIVDVTVQYATEKCTATEGVDYPTLQGTVTFIPGQTSKTIDVASINDIVFEGSETYFVDLLSPTQATLADPRGQVTLVDDDPNPSPPLGLPPADFNGDGKTDLLWRHDTSGQLAVWNMEGINMTTGSIFDTLTDQSWRIVGTADFSADAKTDILWRHDLSGQLAVWFMNGTTRTGGLIIEGDPAWTAAGTGDFNGDRKPDILWRNATTAELQVWLMDGTTVADKKDVEASVLPDGGWRIAGTGDFNHDGKTDILWRHQDSTQLVAWFMDGVVQTGGTFLTPSTPGDANWRVAAIADVNGDEHADILWRHETSGGLVAWLMNQTTQRCGVFLNPAQMSDPHWKLAGPR